MHRFGERLFGNTREMRLLYFKRTSVSFREAQQVHDGLRMEKLLRYIEELMQQKKSWEPVLLLRTNLASLTSLLHGM